MLEKLDPASDVAGGTHIAVDGELGTQECGSQFGYQFFGSIALGRIDKAGVEFAVEPG